ncbi:MAG: sulfatase [bacterium]|nr:sulfatase [bacterium]
MECDVVPSARETSVDPDQLPRYALSSLIHSAAQGRDVELAWRDGDGLTAHPRGPAPAVVLPAPLAFGAGGDDRLVVDVTTERDLELEVAWSDGACSTPGPPCVARRRLPGPGRHRVPVDLTGRTGAPRDLEVRLPTDAGPVTLHGIRAGTYDPDPDPGTSAAAVPLIGPDDEVDVFATAETTTPRHDPGDGLRLLPREHHAGTPYRAWFAFGLERPAAEARYLVAELDTPPGTRLEAYFAGSVCSYFMETCRLGMVETAPGTFVVDLGAHPWWHGTIAALRLDVTAPAPTPLLVRRAAFVPRDEYRDRLAAQTLPLTLLGGEHPPAIVTTNQAAVTPRPDGTVEIRLDEPAAGVPFQPWLLLPVDATADVARLLVLEGDDVPDGPLTVHFAGSGCPTLSEDCRATVPRNIFGEPVIDLWDAPRWRGTIEALRLNLPGAPGSRFVVRSLRFAPPLTTTTFTAGDTDYRGPRELARLDGLHLGWRIPAGQTLECRFRALQAREVAPDTVTLRIPALPSVLDFARAQVGWIGEDGTIEPAADYTDSFATPRAASWMPIVLRRPTGRVQGLRVVVACSENCDSRAQPGRVVQLARPLYHVPADEPAARPRHLLLVSLDTVRADLLAPYGGSAALAPFLNGLATRATVYEQLYAVDTWTLPTHAAMLTGRHPADFPARRHAGLPADVTTLADHLGARGWRSVAVADGALVAATFGLDRGFEVFDSRHEPFERKHEAFVTRVADATASGAPVFAFLHTYAVHDPYSVAPGPGLDWLTRAGVGTMAVPFLQIGALLDQAGFLAHAEEGARRLRARYEAALHTLDRQLEAVFADPRLADFLRDAVVVFTSDHGELFYEHGGLGHFTQIPYPELTHVPLMVHVPGQSAGRRDATLRSQIEIPGLVLEALGLPNMLPATAPCAEHGHPVAVGTGVGVAPYPASTHLATGVFADGWELIRIVERATGTLAHEETLPLPRFAGAAATAPLTAMRETATCLERRILQTPAQAPAQPALPQEQKDRLRALGYVFD